MEYALGALCSWRAANVYVDPVRLRKIFKEHGIEITVRNPTPGPILRRIVRECTPRDLDVLYVGHDHRLHTVTVIKKTSNVQTGLVETEMVESVTYDCHTGKLLFREEGDMDFVSAVVTRMKSLVWRCDPKDLSRMLNMYMYQVCWAVHARGRSYLVPHCRLYHWEKLCAALERLKLGKGEALNFYRWTLADSEHTRRAIFDCVAEHVRHAIHKHVKRLPHLTQGRRVTAINYSDTNVFKTKLAALYVLERNVNVYIDSYPCNFNALLSEIDTAKSQMLDAIEVCQEKRARVKAEGRVDDINKIRLDNARSKKIG